MTLRIYNRLVEGPEQERIIQEADRRNKLKSGSNNINETITAEKNLQDVIELLANLRQNREPLLHCAVFIVQYAEKKEIMDGIIKKYRPEMLVEANSGGAGSGGMAGQADSTTEAISKEQKPHASRPNRAGSRGRSGKPINTKAPANRAEAHSIEESTPIDEGVKERAEA
ncbi:MAG: hypothetical protein IJI06_05260 [Oscillospiraceae bacterium]|nr:hypothetical protein [Oscillospiraceae bacterium]